MVQEYPVGWRRSSCLSKTVFIVNIIGVVLHMIGFYTINWFTRSYRYPLPTGVLTTEYEGLWQFCWLANSIFKCEGFRDHGSWFEATQAFEVLGFIAAVASLVLIVLYIFVPATSGKRIVFILCMIACFAAAGCILLGIIIYGSKMDNLSWSFALCTIAGIIFAVSGILLIIDMLKR